MEISQYRLSKDLKIPQTRISQIVKGNRRITADTALRLRKYFLALQLSTNNEFVRIEKNLRVALGRGKQTFMVGYRYGGKK